MRRPACTPPLLPGAWRPSDTRLLEAGWLRTAPKPAAHLEGHGPSRSVCHLERHFLDQTPEAVVALQRQGAPWAPLWLRLRLPGPEATPPSPPTGPAQSLLCPMITASCVLQPCLQTCVFLPGTALHLLRELSVPRRRQWAPTPVFLPGESQGWRSLVGCHLWCCTESDMTEVT